MQIPYSIRYSLILPRSFDNMYYKRIVAYKLHKINNNYYYYKNIIFRRFLIWGYSDTIIVEESLRKCFWEEF